MSRAGTPTPPSAASRQAGTFLQDFTILANSPFLNSDNVEGNRIFKSSSFETLEKELSSRNSKAIEHAFQIIRQLPVDPNDIKTIARDPVIFPKQIENISFRANDSPIHVIDPPEFVKPLETADSSFTFPIPLFQANADQHQRSTSPPAANLRPNRSSLSKRSDPRESKSISLFLKKTSGLKKERGGLLYTWLWPDESLNSKFLSRSTTLLSDTIR